MKYIYIFVCLFLMSCASVQPLTGGDKDETPPKVVTVTPDSASLSVNNNTVVFTFDEYVKTSKLSELLIISPNQKTKPKTSVKGKKVILTLEDTLIQNTTYTIQFNGSIIDINEGNPLVNYNYVFSTGSYLDSLEYRGVVRDVQTNKPCKQCNVHLYKSNNDSIILTGKPDYLAKTDDAGLFIFQNLPNDSFRRIALKDENNNLTLDPEELISLSSMVYTSATTKDTIKVFPTLKNEKLKTELIKSDPGKITLKLNKPIVKESYGLFINNTKQDYTLSFSLDTISTFYTAKTDTNFIKLIGNNDTITNTYIIPLNKLNHNPALKLVKTSPLTIRSSTPIIVIDTTKFKFLKDSTSIPVYVNKKSNTDLEFTEIENVPNKIIIDSGALTDIYNKSNIADTIHISKSEITSTTNITFQLDSLGDYVIHLLDNQNIIFRQLLSETTTITLNNLKSGMYKVKIIKDTNKNGIWDTGDFFTRKQPESIQYSEPFEVRENWDKELIIKVL